VHPGHNEERGEKAKYRKLKKKNIQGRGDSRQSHFSEKDIGGILIDQPTESWIVVAKAGKRNVRKNRGPQRPMDIEQGLYERDGSSDKGKDFEQKVREGGGWGWSKPVSRSLSAGIDRQTAKRKSTDEKAPDERARRNGDSRGLISETFSRDQKKEKYDQRKGTEEREVRGEQTYYRRRMACNVGVLKTACS